MNIIEVSPPPKQELPAVNPFQPDPFAVKPTLPPLPADLFKVPARPKVKKHSRLRRILAFAWIAGVAVGISLLSLAAFGETVGGCG